MTATIASDDQITTLRRRVMRALADSPAEDIATCMSSVDVPASKELRLPESGLVMIRGRIGGDGAPFNFGEATVTRAAVRLESGEMGFSYVLGRDPRKARLMAICDAMVQSAHGGRILEFIVAPLERAMIARRQRKDAQTAATRVNFFTLVRGED